MNELDIMNLVKENEEMKTALAHLSMLLINSLYEDAMKKEEERECCGGGDCGDCQCMGDCDACQGHEEDDEDDCCECGCHCELPNFVDVTCPKCGAELEVPFDTKNVGAMCAFTCPDCDALVGFEVEEMVEEKTPQNHEVDMAELYNVLKEIQNKLS